MERTSRQESLSEKYKNLFVRSKNLIVSPKKEWESIFNEKSDINNVLASYVLPYLGILSLITFVSYIASHHNVPYEAALKRALSEFTSFFFGLYVTFYITKNILPKFTSKLYFSDVKNISYKLIAYSSIAIYLVKIAIALIPQLNILQFMGVYCAYLAWAGTGYIGAFETRDLRIVLTVVVSVLLLFVPYFISMLFFQFVGI